MDSEWRLLTSATQEKYSSRKATIVPPSPSLGCLVASSGSNWLYFMTQLTFTWSKEDFLSKSISEMFIVFNLNKLDKNYRATSMFWAQNEQFFAWLRFSECVPQFIPSLCRENISSFSKWWQISRRYKSCESCPGDRSKKVKHLSSPPHPGLKFANKTHQTLRLAGIHPRVQGQCIIDRQIP